jgi:hypothetical protein
MEKLLQNTPVPWVKVTNPSTGETYYSTANHEYKTRDVPDPISIKNITVGDPIPPIDTGSFVITASFRSPDLNFTKGDGSTFNLNLQSLQVDYALTASYAFTASYVTTSQTASYVLNAVSSSFATTASYAINHAVITSSYICDGKLNANQSFATGSDAVIAFVDYADPNNWLSGSKFIPNITGYYNMSFGAWLNNAGVSSNQVNIQMRKNGGQTMVILQQPLNNGTGISLSGNRVVYMNGTTDYIEWTVFQGAGAGPTGTLLQGTADGSGTWFSAFLITQ